MNPALFITVLCGTERDGWLAPALMERVFEALGESARLQRQVTIYFQKDASPVDRARNLGVEAFLRSNCDWSLMLDNDTAPPPHFLKLVDEAEQDGKSVVGAPCLYLSENGLQWNAGYKRGDRYDMHVTALPKDWVRCDVLGGAFLLVHRRVFRQLQPPYFTLDPAYNRAANEDFRFCEKAAKAGFSIWAHGGYTCEHLHTVALGDLYRAMTAQGLTQ